MTGMTSQQRIARASIKRDQMARIAAAKAQAQAQVAQGTCPQCGTKLVRNLALTGWWQCGAFGEPGFRKAEFKDLAHCNYQTFTD